MQELETLLSSHKLDEPHAAALRLAAARHDWGKAHEVFQRTLHKHDDSTELLAKQVWSRGGHERQHFRHELASALAMLASGDSDLAVYVVAAHHGRIRMGIRSMPGETEREQRRRARGIEDGDCSTRVRIGAGYHRPGHTAFARNDGTGSGRRLLDRPHTSPERCARTLSTGLS